MRFLVLRRLVVLGRIGRRAGRPIVLVGMLLPLLSFQLLLFLDMLLPQLLQLLLVLLIELRLFGGVGLLLES